MLIEKGLTNNDKGLSSLLISLPFLFVGATLKVDALPGLSLLITYIGLILVSIALSRFRKFLKRKKILQQYPNYAWFADGRWDGFRLKSESGKKVVSIGMLALFLVLCCFISVSFVRLSGYPGAYVAAFFLIILTILAIIFTISNLVQYIKFGNSELILGQIPFAVGKEVKCVALLPNKFKHGQFIKAKISCIEQRIIGKSRHQPVKTKTMFSLEKTAKIDASNREGKKLILPISFEIRNNLPSTKSSELLSYEWKIDLVAKVPGLDFQCTFPIPVYVISDESFIKYRRTDG